MSISICNERNTILLNINYLFTPMPVYNVNFINLIFISQKRWACLIKSPNTTLLKSKASIITI